MTIKTFPKKATIKKEKLSVLEMTALAYICCNNLRIEKDSALKANSLDTLLVLCMAIKHSGNSVWTPC